MSDQQLPLSKPLGTEPLPEQTFELDLKIFEKYLSFSAELLRLALLAIGAIGFIVTKIILNH